MANSKHPIGIIGAGTMGAGIAQLAATHGWTVFLSDVDKGVIRKGIDGVQKRLDRLVDKGIMTVLERKEALSRIRAAKDENDLKECDLVIEAVVEDLGVKTMVLSRVARVLPKDAVIASNTSSLSITKIADALGEPFRGRVIGMHLFNPAPLMPLVEVAGTEYSSAEALKRATLIAEAWGKTVVRCNDTPGFIVNRSRSSP
jgi:3-hydroxybutyryl-CoA dehydrogenase